VDGKAELRSKLTGGSSELTDEVASPRFRDWIDSFVSIVLI